MTRKAGPTRDPFAFSLGGMKVITPFMPALAVASDHFEVRARDAATQPESERKGPAKKLGPECPSAA